MSAVRHSGLVVRRDAHSRCDRALQAAGCPIDRAGSWGTCAMRWIHRSLARVPSRSGPEGLDNRPRAAKSIDRPGRRPCGLGGRKRSRPASHEAPSLHRNTTIAAGPPAYGLGAGSLGRSTFSSTCFFGSRTRPIPSKSSSPPRPWLDSSGLKRPSRRRQLVRGSMRTMAMAGRSLTGFDSTSRQNGYLTESASRAI